MNHVDSAETRTVVETQEVDSVLNLLEHDGTFCLLSRVERAGQVEFVAADVVVPHEGAGGLGGHAATAVLVAAIFIADVGVGEVGVEDGVEDGAAEEPSGVRIVGGQDVEAVTVRDGPGMALSLRHGDLLLLYC